MKLILSPAKQQLSVTRKDFCSSRPLFLKEAVFLAELMKQYSIWQLESLLRISPKLALKAYSDYERFDEKKVGDPALLSYSGLAFQSMNPADFTTEELLFANDTIRIFSALYGMLRPLDGIQPYRLEMLSKVKVDGKSLYRFWADDLYKELFRNGETVINLASGEYARMVTPYLTLKDHFISCEFLIPRRSKLIALPTAAKMARGNMARFVTKERIRQPEEIKQFNEQGFHYRKDLSSSTRFVFVKEDELC